MLLFSIVINRVHSRRSTKHLSDNCELGLARIGIIYPYHFSCYEFAALEEKFRINKLSQEIGNSRSHRRFTKFGIRVFALESNSEFLHFSAFQFATVLDQSLFLLPYNLTFTTISMLSYAAAIIAWSSILFYFYGSRQLLPQILAVLSSILGFVSLGYSICQDG